jgi:hypothetical protein
VYDSQGAFVGAVWNGVLGPWDPMAILSAEHLFGVLDQVKQVLPDVRAAALDGRPSPQDLQPGKCMGVLWLWGETSVGTFGIVSVVENRVAIVLAHNIHGSTTGPRRLALCSAAALSAVPSPSGDVFEMQAGDVIGAVVADSPFGTVAIVGADPQGIELTIRTSDADPQQARRYWMARDPLYLALAARAALEDVSGVRQSHLWRWSARCLERTGEVLASTSADEESPEAMIAAIVDVVALYGDRVSAVEVVRRR